MADVRSMLRQERAARQQDTPKRPAPAPASTAVPSKKRKADDEDTVVEVRKRNKPDEPKGLPAGFFDSSAATEPQPSAAAKPKQPEATPTPPPAQASYQDDVDEEEWAAFQRDVATPPPEQITSTSVLQALNGNATISAAPMTAAELAAQAREEQSAQRGKRDVEVEAEKEDAARNLEEELDEMEELEERVRRLREKREAIRKTRDTGQIAAVIPTEDRKAPEVEDIGNESEEGSDEDDFDDWRFRTA